MLRSYHAAGRTWFRICITDVFSCLGSKIIIIPSYFGVNTPKQCSLWLLQIGLHYQISVLSDVSEVGSSAVAQ